MANLTQEEKEILYRAHEIRERLRAEELEAGEISLKEAERQSREDLEETFGRNAAVCDEDETAAFAAASSDRWTDEEKKSRRTDKREKKSSKKKEKKQPEVTEKKRDQNVNRKKEKKRRTLRGTILKFLLTLLITIAVIAAIAYLAICALITTTNYQPYETSYVRASDVSSDKMVTNILLIGTDSRVANEASRSDAMIVLSINRKKGKIVMTSILRDSYVNIPGYGQNRINHAYQMGGAALLIQTIEENFKLCIDHYMQVDFYNFIEVVDAFGGVGIEVTQDELNYINGYVSEVNHYEGKEEGYSFLNAPGYQILNGRQALAYSRIRYIGTDFARTERQRTVLNALLKKAKTNPVGVFVACQRILPDLTTDISDAQMAKLLLGAPLYVFYDMTQFRVPAEGCWWNELMGGSQEVLGIDFNTNNAQLRSAIYD